MILKFLFPRNYGERSYSLLLLALRFVFGLLLLNHGIQKIVNFSEMSEMFPDPIGLGSSVALGLAVFAEFFCSIAFIFGALYRLSMIPMIVTMAVAFFAVHGGVIDKGELAFAYLLLYAIMYVAGPGVYSIDYWLSRRIGKSKSRR